jgi:hypothetical protein
MFFTDLSKYLVAGETSEITSETQWRKVPYETAEFSGVMLTAGGCTNPKPLKIKLPVSGKYRIYLGMIYAGDTTITSIKPREDYGKVTIRNLWMQKECWQSYEWIEETYFACEDLTDNLITIEKPKNVATPLTSSIAYIRLEKAEETPLYKDFFRLKFFQIFRKTPRLFPKIIRIHLYALWIRLSFRRFRLLHLTLWLCLLPVRIVSAYP